MNTAIATRDQLTTIAAAKIHENGGLFMQIIVRAKTNQDGSFGFFEGPQLLTLLRQWTKLWTKAPGVVNVNDAGELTFTLENDHVYTDEEFNELLTIRDTVTQSTTGMFNFTLLRSFPVGTDTKTIIFEVQPGNTLVLIQNNDDEPYRYYGGTRNDAWAHFVSVNAKSFEA